MTTTNTTHTAASLAAIYDRNPRELDAIAAKVIFGKQASWEYDSFIDRIEPFIAENFDLAPAAVAAALAFYFDHKDEIDKAIEDEGRRGGSQESTYVNGD